MVKRLSIKYILYILFSIILINNSSTLTDLLFNSIILILLIYITISPYINSIGNIIESALIMTVFIIIYIMNNLISLYITIELMNICIYIYAFRKYSNLNNNNIINYYIISSISSILLLYSILIIYRDVGDISLSNILYILPYTHSIAIYLLLISIIIKLGLGPFYLYKLELYNQLNIIQLLLLSTVPIYLYIYLISFIIYYLNFPNIQYFILILFNSLIFIALIISSIDYINQNKINILFIYSSIYNTALLLYNIVLYIINNQYNMYIYIIIYMINIIGLMQLINISKKSNNILPIYKLLSIVYIFSFVGPLGGFLSKLYLLFYSFYFGTYSLLYLFFTIIIIISTLLIASLYIKFINYYYFNDIIAFLPSDLEDNSKPIYAIISLTFFILLFSIFLIPYCPF